MDGVVEQRSRLLLFGWGKAATSCLEVLFSRFEASRPSSPKKRPPFEVHIVSHTNQDDENRLDTCLLKLNSHSQIAKPRSATSERGVQSVYVDSSEVDPGAPPLHSCHLFPDDVPVDEKTLAELILVPPPSSGPVKNDVKLAAVTTATATAGAAPFDLIISVSYRKRISCLHLAPERVNFHPSLLPRHRGCFSGFWVIFDGDAETGVSCHHMLEKFDQGGLVHVERCALDYTETSKSLYEKLIPVTKTCFEKVMDMFFEGGCNSSSCSLLEGGNLESGKAGAAPAIELMEAERAATAGFTTSFRLLRKVLLCTQRLGIEPPSNPGEIKRAYFAKAKECHPDIHGDAKTKEFQELSAAYAVLSDERKKASYDASGYQDRNYDAPSDPNRHHRSDIPDLDAAFAMFRQVFSEYGFQMYYDTLQQDVQNTYEKAVETQSYEPFYDLANRRKGLVFGIVVPALLLFRFPWLALAATRMLGSVGMFLFQVIARNPRLQAAVAAWLWKRIVEFSARMSRDGEKSSSTSEDARKTPGGRKTKR
eukprot:g13199.t1